MKRIRLRVTILASWLVFIIIIDRLMDPIAISKASIALVFVMATVTILMPRKPAVLVWVITIVPIIALFLIKLWAGTLLGDFGIYLAIIETFIIAFTIILANRVSAGLSEFESSIAQITLGQSEKAQDTSRSGLGTIYREVRRARNHQRPLALISIGVEEESFNLAVEKMVEEIQLSMVKQYKLQRLSKMLCDQLEDCAIVVKDTDRFLAILPETNPEELPIVLERLRQKAQSQVNIELKIGAATLPNDGYTFEGLLEKATQAMETSQEPIPYVVLDQKSIEHRTN